MEERQSNAERAKHVLKDSGVQLVIVEAAVPAKAQLVERIELNGLKSSKAKNEKAATRELAAEEPAGQKRELDATHPGENVTSTGAIMLALFGQKEEDDGHRGK